VIAATSHLLRLTRAGFVFAREGVFALVDTRPLPLPARAGIAVARLLERPSTKSGESRLAAALSKLGPTYVKLGQFLATRPDVVGTTIARDLESLQDKMAPFPQGEAETAVAAALGKPLSSVYASFGPAVAAASIAQVHRAEIDIDDVRMPVAVKVLRPGIERRETGGPGQGSLRGAAGLRASDRGPDSRPLSPPTAGDPGLGPIATPGVPARVFTGAMPGPGPPG